MGLFCFSLHLAILRWRGFGSVLIWDVGPGLAPARPPRGAALQSNWDPTEIFGNYARGPGGEL
jgi:hypothetical protein